MSNFIHLRELIFLLLPKKKIVMVLESVAFYGPLFGRRGRFVIFEVRLFTVQDLTENCILESENEFQYYISPAFDPSKLSCFSSLFNPFVSLGDHAR